MNDGDYLTAAVIFEDKFKEINKDSCCIYAIVALNNRKIMMYRYLSNEKEKIKGLWESFREIDGAGNICYSINYFYDEMALKTYLFFGFCGTPMRIYSLKENSYDKSKMFPIDNNEYSRIYSINFLIIKNSTANYKKYVIYTQYDSNLINIGDVDNGEIVQRFALPDTHSNNDLLVWSCSEETNIQQKKKTSLGIYLIVASMETSSANNKGAVNILSLEEDLSLVLRKRILYDVSPVNLIKTKVPLKRNIENMNNEEIREEKEVFVVFSGRFDKSCINAYEN